jgi:hypothetical protein
MTNFLYIILGIMITFIFIIIIMPLTVCLLFIKKINFKTIKYTYKKIFLGDENGQ